MRCCSQLLLLVTVLVGIESITCLPTNLPRVIFGRPLGGFMNNPFRRHTENKTRLAVEDVEMGTLPQILDHFKSSDKRTWQQHYQYNPKFYNGSGVIFLLVGGASKIDVEWIADYSRPYMLWAKKHGAAVFQVEHRFYGESHPLPNATFDYYHNYNTLTVDQALADIRFFIKTMNRMYFPSITKPRWLLFGGSYAGVLAAWFREKNPDITIGAISSSSPVDTIMDFWRYNRDVGYAYYHADSSCSSNIESAFYEIHEKVFTIKGREELVEKLELDTPFRDDVMPIDIQFFFSNIIGVFQAISMYTVYNKDNATGSGLGISQACEIMNNSSEPDLIKRVNNVQRFYNGFFFDVNIYKNPNNYWAYTDEMRNVTYDPPDFERAAARAWAWQTCTELGYFQTTHPNWYNMFGSAIPLDFYLLQCNYIFSPWFTADSCSSGTDNRYSRTRYKYGGSDEFNGTNTVFTNGWSDPWLSLGYMNSQPGDVYAYQIEDAVHCADMYPSSPHDKQSLIDARLFIGKQVDKYIAESLTTQESETTTHKPETTSTTTHKPETTSTATHKPETTSTTTHKPETTSTTTQTPRSSAPSLMSFINTFQILSLLHLISGH